MSNAPPKIPTPLLIGAAVLMASSIGLAAVGRLTKAPRAEAPALVSLELRFADEADGGVSVADAATGERIHLYGPGEGGFVRTALRAVVFERKKSGLGAETPLRLTRTQTGRLILADPATGREVGLEAFGAGNAADFGRLLDAKGERS
jgi:putative photosynthetic complex assembly protein